MDAIDTNNCMVVGGVGDITDEAFDPARAVLKISDDTYLMVHCYSESGAPEGDIIDDDDLSTLIEAGGVFSLAEPVKFLPRATFVILGSKFKELLPEVLPPLVLGPLELNPPMPAMQIFLMNELTATRSRVFWTSLSVNKMRPLIDSKKWDEAVVYARLQFDLAEEKVDIAFALARIVQCLTFSGKSDLVVRYINMAQRSWGNDFIALVINCLINSIVMNVDLSKGQK